MARRTNLREQVRNILRDELQGLLEDVRYRVTVLDDAQRGTGRLGSRHLNLASHQLDGYAVTDNTPIAGSIAWSDVNIVYKGVNYAIAAGNTANKYVYWTLAQVDKTLLQSSNAKPVLTDDDVLVFINDTGVHKTVVGKMTHGFAVIDGTVSTNEIASNAIVAAKIIDGGVVAGKLATNAVVAANITNGAVTSLKMPTGAVTAIQLATDAVTAVKIAANAVTDVKILDGAVTVDKVGAAAITDTKLAANAVTTTKILDGAITAAKIPDNTLTGGKLVDYAITGIKIQDGSITGTQIGAGSVATNKLNTALHMIF